MSVDRFENEDFSVYPETEYYNENNNNDIDQQSYVMSTNMGFINRRTYNKQQTYQQYSSNDVGAGIQMPAQSFDDYKPTEPTPIDINSLVLPPPNMQCYVEPVVPRGTVTYLRHNEPTVTRTITLNFNSVKTVVRENIIHHQHNKTVITNVNRNHWHTQRILVKDNNYHHYLINNVVRINDIHHQKIEQVRGEGKSFNDYKQTQRIEAAKCEFTDKDNKSDSFGQGGAGVNSSGGGGGGGGFGANYIDMDSGSGGGPNGGAGGGSSSGSAGLAQLIVNQSS